VKKQFGTVLQKIGLKEAALKIYFPVVNSINSVWETYRARTIPNLIRKRSKAGVLAIDICTEHGLGAKIEWCIEILAYCEEHQLQPSIKFSYPGNEADFFSPYFSIKSIGNNSNPLQFTKISLMSELGFLKNYGNLLTIDKAHELIDKYFGSTILMGGK
jgi:hypothetical protein